MIELILGTYGALCWLLFKKLKLIKVTTYTVCTAILIGVALVAGILLLLMRFHPATKDARLYVYTTPIVPQVRGLVLDVVDDGRGLKAGDVLFQIDPKPYRFEVNRLEAALAEANSSLAQLEARLRGAEAATKQARSELLVSESQFDRQAREDVERANQEVTQIKGRNELAQKQLARNKELFDQKVISQLEYDRIVQQSTGSEAELQQAEAAQRQSNEKLRAGGSSLQAMRDALARAEAAELEVRVAFDAESEGLNPQVRQIVAQLDAAVWELDQTTVRAPANGYVTQLTLRPGQMVVPMPLAPVMVFVHDEKPVLAASFPQNVIANFKPGLEVELAFKAYPGQIYPATIERILPASAEGQLVPGGQLRSLTPGSAPGRIIVVFEYGKEVEDLQLPGGSLAYAAVYTEHLHALSFVRKILLRIKSWENFIFLP